MNLNKNMLMPLLFLRVFLEASETYFRKKKKTEHKMCP